MAMARLRELENIKMNYYQSLTPRTIKKSPFLRGLKSSSSNIKPYNNTNFEENKSPDLTFISIKEMSDIMTQEYLPENVYQEIKENPEMQEEKQLDEIIVSEEIIEVNNKCEMFTQTEEYQILIQRIDTEIQADMAHYDIDSKENFTQTDESLLLLEDQNVINYEVDVNGENVVDPELENLKINLDEMEESNFIFQKDMSVSDEPQQKIISPKVDKDFHPTGFNKNVTQKRKLREIIKNRPKALSKKPANNRNSQSPKSKKKENSDLILDSDCSPTNKNSSSIIVSQIDLENTQKLLILDHLIQEKKETIESLNTNIKQSKIILEKLREEIVISDHKLKDNSIMIRKEEIPNFESRIKRKMTINSSPPKHHRHLSNEIEKPLESLVINFTKESSPSNSLSFTPIGNHLNSEVPDPHLLHLIPEGAHIPS